MKAIYLDYNATTPVAPTVAETIEAVLREVPGNPSSSHVLGREAHRWVETARERVASLIGASPEEIIFTGGGSEANNLALKGVALERGEGEIITQQTEHPAVLEPLRFLERHGDFRVVRLPVDGTGLVDPEDVRKAITRATILISIQHANNETGTVHPLERIAEIAREREIPLHTDAAQTPGKIPVRVDELGVGMLSIAGHKLYGPKGVGALWVAGNLALEPLIHGAGHERGRRAGTEAVHQLAGLGEACRLAAAESDETLARLRDLRDSLHHRLLEAIPDLRLHGHPGHRLPNTLNVGFPGVNGAELLEAASGVAASTGSACHAGEVRLSPVLEAMRVPAESGRGAVRLSVGRPTTPGEVEEAAAVLVDAFHRVRRGCSGGEA